MTICRSLNSNSEMGIAYADRAPLERGRLISLTNSPAETPVRKSASNRLRLCTLVDSPIQCFEFFFASGDI